MMGNESTTFVNRCSLVVRAVDLWSGAPPSASSIRVAIRGHNRAPMRTSDGSYAFLDYPYDRCTVTVTSPQYLDYEREMALGAGVPIITAGLMPSRFRSAPAAASGLRFRIVGEKTGKPVKDAEVYAYVDDDRAICGRIAEDQAVSGMPSIRITPAAIKLMPGDVFVVRGKSGAADWAKVSEFADYSGNGEDVALETPLKRTWSRGERLLIAAATRSDADGIVTVPFRGVLPSEFQTFVEIRLGGRKIEASFTGSGGEVRQFPDLKA
ncbi:hypothetical protein [Cohnella panacarvi]|uniref:hypothetical protein n=1 Tax=Cohnella panacarvi TaxID=400776 RepID=UPI0004AE701E|nr:hypothetical protein [Cohnella panacarvi]